MNVGLSDLIAKFKASLMSSAEVFEREHDGDNIELYKLMIVRALATLRQLSPLTLSHVLTLEANRQSYPAPQNIWCIKAHSWGQHQCAPWEPGFISRIPDISVGDGELMFSFAPSSAMLQSLGSRYQFFYIANYVVDEDPLMSNVSEHLEPLLLLLCQASAMQFLMVRGATKAVNVKPGVGAIRKGTPSEVYESLMHTAQSMALHR